jgi:hypothetical protein
MMPTEQLGRLRALDPASADAIDQIVAERVRQIESELWSPAHDDSHGAGQMAEAAGVYAIGAIDTDERPRVMNRYWPWSEDWYKPGAAARDLTKAGALIVAEMARLARVSAKAGA